MNLRRLNLLDWILVFTAIAAVAVVYYRYRTQGYLDWVDLAYMTLFVSGYAKYRTTSTRGVTEEKDSVQKVANHTPEPTSRSRGGSS
jgi:hypothetical protein